ncbi:MAG: hypothetical protein V3S80_03055 [Sulfurimonadaceae bacterium]|jgi:hypothetical protein
MINGNMDELRAEFDKFVHDKCEMSEDGSCDTDSNPDLGDAVDEEPYPGFVDELQERLLAPSKSGVYLSRIDIKRVAEGIDESIPIKERDKMIKALFRHTTKREYLSTAFAEFNKHMNGRVMIYTELAEAFPLSREIFDGQIAKVKKTQKMFDQIVADYEEIEPTFDPMMI